nr:putative ribonuclease H-like domain-containing protein [Tanacetum cinerariifolium]
YPRDSPFYLEAFSDSDYAGASLDRKSTTRGCQFLGKRLILWQCKKQNVVANSTTKEEYVVAASCCRQVLWIQNQMLDYGFNLMNTKIYIDNENGKKIIITEASIRRDLRLDDAEGTACLPNAAIFEELARMGVKTTAWNEFSSTMAYAIICLANNQKFNFSKCILDNMVKNLKARVKLYMFLRFFQVFVNHQLGDMSYHKGIFVSPSLTKKVFANMKRVGTGFSGAITPLFETMMVQVPEKVGEIPTDTQDTLILTQPSSSQPRGSTNPEGSRGRTLRFLTLSHKLRHIYLHLPMIHYLVINQVVEIKKLKKIVEKLKGKKKKRTHGLKRLYKGRMNDEDLFGVSDLDDDEVILDVTTSENVEQNATVAKKEVSVATDEVVITAKSVAEIKAAKPRASGVTIQEPSEFRTTSPSQPSLPPQPKDKGKGIMVELEKPLKKKDQIELDEEVARKLVAGMKAKIDEEERIARDKNEANRAVIEEWDDVQATIDADRQRKYFTAKRAEEIRNKPPTKAQQKSLRCTYMKNMEGYKQKDFKGKSFDDIKKMFDKVYKRESAKRQRLEKEDDTAKLKRCLEIVPEDDDDVTIEATPLSSKSRTIVDYKIYKEGKKSYFKIIRADGNS